MNFQDELRRVRKGRRLTQQQMAKQNGITRDYYNRIERGTRRCNPQLRAEIASALNEGEIKKTP